jgi:NMD protein affecting ribosome stability and mRNA decay
MSYSVCAKCNEMVPLYEKYCSRCLRKDSSLVQDSDFHNPSRCSEPNSVTTDRVCHSCGERYSWLTHTVCPKCYAWPTPQPAERSKP